MRSNMKNKMHAKLSVSDSILSAAKSIGSAVSNGGASGIAVVLDQSGLLMGVVTDGDIRDAICRGLDLNQPINLIMNKKPIVINGDSHDIDFEINSALNEAKRRGSSISKIISIDSIGVYKDILDVNSLILDSINKSYHVRIYGLGFVGLTLAVTLAEHDSLEVEGVDANDEVINSLKVGNPHFYEQGLKPLLSGLLQDKRIAFKALDEIHGDNADVHIVSVGTPLDDCGNPDKTFLELAAKTIGAVLIPGNLVICRSTVPVGTMRNYFIPLLEKSSGWLRAGIDFNVAFCPERTIEGDALRELRELPQIIGGLTPRCREMAANIFQRFGPTIVRVDSLEAAELVKLINNSYRDLCFAFSNEVALVCDKYNIDAFELIAAANEGYPRNKIYKPSPGVGGICLSKDPFLFVATQHQIFGQDYPKLPRLSRNINEVTALYPIKVVTEYIKTYLKSEKYLKILVVGVAFKGNPETSDIRNSSSILTIKKLQELGHAVSIYDAVVPHQQLLKTKCFVHKTIEEGAKDKDAILFLNNHEKNIDFDYDLAFRSMSNRALLFDGWKQFTKEQLIPYKNLIYSTMGYIG